MIPRNDVIDLYRLLLNREPESDLVINEKRRAGCAADVALEMLKSDEFIHENRELIARMVDGDY